MCLHDALLSHCTIKRSCAHLLPLLFSIIVLVFISHPKLDAGRVFQVSSDPYLNSVGNGVPALMPAHEAIAGVTEQSSDKVCPVTVIHHKVAFTPADVATPEAAEIQQPQKLSARHMHMSIGRGDKGSRPAVLIELSCSW